MDLKVVSNEEDVLRIEASGHVVTEGALPSTDKLCALLGPRGFAQNVALSLAHAGFVNSQGLSWLLICHKRFAEAGGKFVLYSLPPWVQQTIQIMRLNLVLNVERDEAAAIQRIRGAT